MDMTVNLLDKNNNGIIEKSEFPGGDQETQEEWEMMVCVADQDEDRVMSTAVFKVIYSQIIQGNMSFLQENAGRCAPGSPGGSVSTIDQAVDRADTNGDGILDESEFLASGPGIPIAIQWDMLVCLADQNVD